MTTVSPELALPLAGQIPTRVVEEAEDSHGFLCDLWRSTRYHRAREAFFQSWSSLFAFLSLIAGSSVVVTILAEAPPIWSVLAGGMVAMMQAAELVFRLADKARIHASLAGEFLALERLTTMSGDLTKSRLRELRGEMLSIETREPPIRRYLDLMCHNEVARAINSKDIEPLTWFQRTFCHYLAGPSAT